MRGFLRSEQSLPLSPLSLRCFWVRKEGEEEEEKEGRRGERDFKEGNNDKKKEYRRTVEGVQIALSAEERRRELGRRKVKRSGWVYKSLSP